MQEKKIQKTVNATIDLSDIDFDEVSIAKIAHPLDAETKKFLLKKILGLADSFQGAIDLFIQDQRVHFQWNMNHINIQAENLHRHAIQFARKGELNTALQKWEEATKINPSDPDYFFNLGVVYFEFKKYIESIDSLTRTLAICPIYHKAHLILGTAYLKIRKFENAKKHIEKSLKFNKNNLMALLNLGAVYSILKDYRNGIMMFEMAIEKSPGEASAYMGLAKIYSTLEDSEKSNYYFKKVIEFDKKGNLANYAKRSIITPQINRPDDDSVELSSENPEDYYSEGYRNYIIADFDKSEKLYKKYLTLKPDDDYVWYALGEVQLRFGKAELAAESFRKAIKFSPSKGLYFKELAIVFDKAEKYDKVIAAIEKAKELGKTDSITLCLHGKALYKTNRINEAIPVLEEALQKNKNNLLAKYYLSKSLLKNEDMDDAAWYLEEILNAPMNSPLKQKSESLLKGFK
ncbi:MAG: tetratricopeptide repeat protein [Candidatus Zhuqueibacterota bacterium]